MIKGKLEKRKHRARKAFVSKLGNDGYKSELNDTESRLSIDIWGHKHSSGSVREITNTIERVVNWYISLSGFSKYVADLWIDGVGSIKPIKKRAIQLFNKIYNPIKNKYLS